MHTSEKVEWLVNKIIQLEHELEKIRNAKSGWVTLQEAANELDTTPSAIRQRLRHKDRPMPEGKAWKQTGGKRCKYKIHMPTYRRLM